MEGFFKDVPLSYFFTCQKVNEYTSQIKAVKTRSRKGTTEINGPFASVLSEKQIS